MDAKLLKDTKEGFFTLCSQYERMGALFQLYVKAQSHPVHKVTIAKQAFQRILEQHHEVGEQLKNLGLALDKMGGSLFVQFPFKN